ncbi:TPA: hypothetical protein ACN376_003941 [Vibrio parahaemolyticus]
MGKVHIRPKDRGLSIFIEGDEKLYEAKGDNDQEVVIVAKSEQEANSLAYEHFGSTQFKLFESTWNSAYMAFRDNLR